MLAHLSLCESLSMVVEYSALSVFSDEREPISRMMQQNSLNFSDARVRLFPFVDLHSTTCLQFRPIILTLTVHIHILIYIYICIYINRRARSLFIPDERVLLPSFVRLLFSAWVSLSRGCVMSPQLCRSSYHPVPPPNDCLLGIPQQQHHWYRHPRGALVGKGIAHAPKESAIRWLGQALLRCRRRDGGGILFLASSPR